MRILPCAIHVLKWVSWKRNEASNSPSDVHLESLSVRSNPEPRDQFTPQGRSACRNCEGPEVRSKGTAAEG
jgi:hypothetical protein